MKSTWLWLLSHEKLLFFRNTIVFGTICCIIEIGYTSVYYKPIEGRRLSLVCIGTFVFGEIIVIL
jgi:hypothetical protein